MKLNIVLIYFVFITRAAFAQTDTTNKFTIAAYGELYYSYDFSNPDNHEKSAFLYNHKRHNEVNANLALIRASYLDKNYRSNVGVMAGNYAQYNLSTEPAWAQFIYEANIGVKLSEKRSIWLDAGILPSHIGFENAISADCWTLTRSLVAENSPYYEAGIKLSYQSLNEKVTISALYLNGWQKIQKPDHIQSPSFGLQFTCKPNRNLTLNYSNFLGTDQPDTMNAFRHYHNFYLQYETAGKSGIIAGVDIGNDKAKTGDYETWIAPVLVLRQNINKLFSIAFRGEYYHDREQIIIKTGSKNGFQTFGISSNLDVSLNERMQFRIEGKMFKSKDRIFMNDNRNFSLTTNLTIKL